MGAIADRDTLLAFTFGYAVEADDGPVGVVETPLFPPDRSEPDFLVLRVGRLHPRRPVVSAARVDDVDPTRRIVHIRGRRDEIADLPEHLPLAI
jgi:hypothetical protein